MSSEVLSKLSESIQNATTEEDVVTVKDFVYSMKYQLIIVIFLMFSQQFSGNGIYDTTIVYIVYLLHFLAYVYSDMNSLYIEYKNYTILYFFFT